MSASDSMGTAATAARQERIERSDQLTVAAPVVALPHPGGPAEERYRLIAVRLEAALERRGTRGARVVVVTSPQKGEGKTTTALHVATALARDLGRRVALVDGCLRAPGVARALGAETERGLGDVLSGAMGLEDVIWRGEEGGPFVIPAADPPRADRGPGVRALAVALEALRRTHGYDYLVVDAPALGSSSDAAILGRTADGVLMVVRAGATKREALASALEALVDVPLVGVVLNDYDGPVQAAPRALITPGGDE